MRKTVQEIAQLLHGEVVGDASVVITGVSGIKEAKAGDITFIANPKYLPLVDKTLASAIITSREVTSAAKPIIRTENPSYAFAQMIALLMPSQTRHPTGIHPSAVIASTAKVGRNVAVGAHAVIEENARLGDNTVIYAGTFVGHETVIGKDCLIYPNVSIRERCSIGDRVIVHSGTVIGADGFGFANVQGVHQKIPQIGIVEICDDVEIGANVTIDRARFDKTVIGKGTKIDNLVQIAHNVIIGENSLIVAQAGISGSTIIGNHVVLAGQAGLVGHITVGDNAIVAAQGGVTKSVPANTMVSGYPARPHAAAIKVNACVQNLPRLYDKVKELTKKIEELEARLKKQTL
ncbi:MAG TPA: UDP-3-O-(3-hydroxymyristoyl)glucosamine N-acyltransferase [Candidatus Omnitrophota bacterium]|mgnify:CR=1 FL=1|nr:UDP-3-O-(3-hydroxymyristoyl)glucosamine N-acyltransferase [Candidatus Omnitrophota bacterium]HPT07203.1 UDP-3-O-(3-hydroxymyristoyl)glucosamine N-acyltransferase [Candidatus Omnitrophota bacterium]